ncbi:MAG TPA: nucleoside hydrolase [Thermoanaerobaculia bacterium]|jgi:purine nucleosidase|nr:nucleoside hydrolase [Thermoanaerobaculia bacterium]
MANALKLLIDTDNAAGSPSGDVDDAFAVAALLRSGLPVAGVSSVGGNTSEEQADRNNRVLGELCGYTGPYMRGVQAGDVPDRIDRIEGPWTAGPIRFVALGPLTNLAALMGKAAISEAILVGSNLTSRGRFPPWWPHEFNLTHDREATRAVFASDLPLTIVPLDVARQLRVGPGEMQTLKGELGTFLRRCSVRWTRRSFLVRGSRSFPVFDLAAAACVIDPSLVSVEETRVRLHSNLWIEYGCGDQRLRMIRDLDAKAIWRRLVALVNGL